MNIKEEVKQYEDLTFKGCYREEIELSNYHELTPQEKHDIYVLACGAMGERGLSLLETFSKVFIAGKINGIRQERRVYQ